MWPMFTIWLELYLLHIAQIQFVLYNLEALCLTIEWQYASGSSHDAASICLVELIILHLVQSTNQTVTDPRTKQIGKEY